MPDIPVAGGGGSPYNPGMETRITRLEEDVREVKTGVIEIKAMLTATLPHLAAKAELAEKPGKTYMWGILAVLLTAYACGLAGLAVLK